MPGGLALYRQWEGLGGHKRVYDYVKQQSDGAFTAAGLIGLGFSVRIVTRKI